MRGPNTMTIIKCAGRTILMLMLIAGNSNSAIIHKFNTASSGRTYPDSGLDMVNACRMKRATCVIDFTSHTRCTAKASENAAPDEEFGKTLDNFTSKCPAYRWNKRGLVYIIEPRVKSDSALNVPVEGISRVRTASELMQSLIDSSGLVPDRVGILDGHSLSPDMRRKVTFALPATTLKRSLIEAARQSQPSYWLVHYKKDGIAAESLDFIADTYEIPKGAK